MGCGTSLPSLSTRNQYHHSGNGSNKYSNGVRYEVDYFPLTAGIAMRKSSLMSFMSEPALDELLGYCELRKFPQGTILFGEGEKADGLYLVADGVAELHVGLDDATMRSLLAKNSKESKAKIERGGRLLQIDPKSLLCVREVGGIFGTEALLNDAANSDISYALPSVDTAAERKIKNKAGKRRTRRRSGDCKRIATSLAVSDVTCLYLDQQQWAQYLAIHPNMRSRLLMACGYHMEHHLANIEYLKGIEANKMSLLVSLFSFIRLPKGTVLFHEGELSPTGNSMYFLFDGSVSVLRDDYEGNPREVAVVEKGNVVGEVGLIIDLPRTATIVAGREDCLLLELSKHNFTNFVRNCPSILEGFKMNLTHHYSIPLHHLVHSPFVLQFFIKHCKQEYSTENIEFWIAARDFRNTVDDGTKLPPRGYRHFQAAGKEARTTSQHSLGIVTEAGTLEFLASLGDRSPMARTPTAAAAAAAAAAGSNTAAQLPGQVFTPHMTSLAAPQPSTPTHTSRHHALLTINTQGVGGIGGIGGNHGNGPSTPTTSRFGYLATGAGAGDLTPSAEKNALLNLISSYKPVNAAGEIMSNTVSYHPPPTPLIINPTMTTSTNNSTARELSTTTNTTEPSTAAASVMSSPTHGARDAASRQARRRSNVSASSNGTASNGGGSLGSGVPLMMASVTAALSSHATTISTPASPSAAAGGGGGGGAMSGTINSELPSTNTEPTIPSLSYPMPSATEPRISPSALVSSGSSLSSTSSPTLVPLSSSSLVATSDHPSSSSSSSSLPPSATSLLLQHSLGALHYPTTATPPDSGRQHIATTTKSSRSTGTGSSGTGRIRSDSYEPAALYVHHSTASTTSVTSGVISSSTHTNTTNNGLFDEKESSSSSLPSASSSSSSSTQPRRGSVAALHARAGTIPSIVHEVEEKENSSNSSGEGSIIKETVTTTVTTTTTTRRQSVNLGKLGDLRTTSKEQRRLRESGESNASYAGNGNGNGLTAPLNDANRKFSFVGSMVTYQDASTGQSKDLFFPTGSRPLPATTTSSATATIGAASAVGATATLPSTTSDASISAATPHHGRHHTITVISSPVGASDGTTTTTTTTTTFGTPTSARHPTVTTSPGSVTVSLLMHSPASATTSIATPSLTISPSPAHATTAMPLLSSPLSNMMSPSSSSPTPLLNALPAASTASSSSNPMPSPTVTVTLALSPTATGDGNNGGNVTSTTPTHTLAAMGDSNHHHHPSTSSNHRRWSSRKLGPLSLPTSHTGGKKVNLSSLFGPPPPAAKKASTLTDSQREVLIEQARAIATEFIANDAPKQVNIADEIQKDILARIERGDVDRTLFVVAQDAILKLMDGDSFMRFKNGALFRECLDAMNSPYSKVLRFLHMM